MVLAGAPLSDSVSFALNATFTSPPCTLHVPEKIPLGNIAYGMKSYPPFTITVNCLSISKAEIYAQSLEALASGSVDMLVMKGVDQKALFGLEEDGQKRVMLNGDTNVTTSGFCVGTNSRTCTLTPKTWVTGDAKAGERSAVIRFNIRYLA